MPPPHLRRRARRQCPMCSARPARCSPPSCRSSSPAGAARVQLPLVLDAGRPGAVRLDRPRALGPVAANRCGCCRRPRPTLAGAPATTSCAARSPSSRRAIQAASGARPGGRRLRRAPGRLLLRGVRVHASLPVYSGGLGVLAGDILKEASDLALPLVAVGLMYRHGYFRQRIDGSGWQHEYWVDTDPDRVPAALVTGDDGPPLTVTVPDRPRDVVAQIWRVDVGRVPLFLLDADRPENAAHRWITPGSTSATRTRAWRSTRCSASAACARCARWASTPACTSTRATPRSPRSSSRAGRAGASRRRGLERARARTVFTTHTPVPAGNDTYPPGRSPRRWAASPTSSGRRSALRSRPRPSRRRGRAVRRDAVRAAPSRAANGVSPRHGEVAREMWHGCGPTARSRTCRSPRHQRRARPDLDRRRRCASCSTVTSATAGSSAPPTPRPGRRSLDPRRGAVGGAQPPARGPGRVRRAAQRHRPARPRGPARLRRGRRARVFDPRR